MTETNEKSIYNISDFKVKKILSNNTNRKTTAILGTFPTISDADEALIILEKLAFSEKVLLQQNDDAKNENSTIFSTETKVTTEFINNIYGSFMIYPPVDLNGLKTTVIYPVTQKHIDKYTPREPVIVNETPEIYKNLILPHITSEQFSLDWVYNILEHKKETERIIFEDTDPETGFILLPDLKWDGRSTETLYILAITHAHNIKSLRDLNGKHLQLLKNIRDKGSIAIEDKFGLRRNQMRIYLHYQPSFYHLHIHFNTLKNEAPGIFCEKSHLIDTVINNIELMSDYYEKCTLSFVLSETDRLWDKIQEDLKNDAGRKKPKLCE